jgi:putative transposase
MELTRGYKVELDLNNRQRTACAKHAGTARFAYNWGLRRQIDSYEQSGQSPSAIDLHRELNKLKQTDFPWMYEVSKCAPQEALRDLDKAFNHFFRRVKEGNGKPGFPKFKSRKRGLGSFRLTGVIRVFETCIQLPRLGTLKLKEKGYIPTTGVHILSATVSEKAGRWFVSVQVKEEQPAPSPATGEPVGVDLGVKAMATCSDGQIFENPRALDKKSEQLARWQRRLSRRKKGSQNREKARRKVANLHLQIANIRQDALHKATSTIVAKTKPDSERPRTIVLEELNVAGMLKNHKLARAIADVGLAEFRRQIVYKASLAGEQVLLADQWYPSSKTCSSCGVIKFELDLSERIFICDSCGLVIDRDLNAALNLVRLTTASSAGSNACGDGKVHGASQVAVAEAGTKHQMSTFG